MINSRLKCKLGEKYDYPCPKQPHRRHWPCVGCGRAGVARRQLVRWQQNSAQRRLACTTAAREDENRPGQARVTRRAAILCALLAASVW